MADHAVDVVLEAHAQLRHAAEGHRGPEHEPDAVEAAIFAQGVAYVRQGDERVEPQPAAPSPAALATTGLTPSAASLSVADKARLKLVQETA